MANKTDKKMTAADYQDKALNKFADLMIERINALSSKDGWSKPWICDGFGSWATNLDNREYNGMNQVMLMMWCQNNNFNIPVFATYDRVMGLNYTKKDGKSVSATDKDGNRLPYCHVVKGAESFPVFITTFTCIHKETKNKIPYGEYKELSDEEQQAYKVYPKLNIYNVFNVAQTNIKETRPELYAKLEQRYGVGAKPAAVTSNDYSFEPMDKIIRDRSWVCPIQITHGNEAYYTPTKDIIVFPEKAQFKDGESFYTNLFHEMAHSTGAESRLNRLKKAPFGSPEYATEELIAELTAVLVGSKYGMVKHLKDDSAAYLKSWLKSLKESTAFIKTILLDVKHASYMITECVDKATQAKDTKVA